MSANATAEPAPLRYEDISPQALLAGQIAAMNEDIAFLASHRPEFVAVPCPACGATEHTKLYDKNGMPHVRCAACPTQYASPRPPPPVIRELYRSSKNYAYWAKHIFPATAASRKERIFRKRAELVANLAKEQGIAGGTVLEIGAGYGFFCECMQDLRVFDRVVAVEPTPDLARICREKGLEVLESFVEDIPTTSPVDVVVSFEVIEHLFEPIGFLRACAALLRPGGHLLLTCPNIEGFETRMLGQHSDTIDHEHLNLFSPDSLAGLVKRVGLEPVQVRTPGVLDADIVRQRLEDKTLPPVPVDPFVRDVVCHPEASVRDTFQAFLTQNRLSSNMLLLARKPG